jgi:hypothetical protein
MSYPVAVEEAFHLHKNRIGAGLCSDCVHARVVESSRGSKFVLCELSQTDPAFPKYAPLPVIRCAGFTRKQT